MAQVENRLDRLEAIEEIRQLKARYFRFLDTKDAAGMLTVFCRDAVFDCRSVFAAEDSAYPGAAAASNWVFEGNRRITDFVLKPLRGWVSVHHGHCHEITIDSADEAHGVIAMEDAIRSPDGKLHTLWGCGHYHDLYRREDDVWRIARSTITRLFADSNLSGWPIN